MIVIAFACIVLGYLGTMFISWQSIDKKKRNHFTHTAMTFIFLGAIGAILVIIDSNNTSNELIMKSKKIETLNNELKVYSIKTANLASELRDYSIKTADLALQLNNSNILLNRKNESVLYISNENNKLNRELRELTYKTAAEQNIKSDEIIAQSKANTSSIDKILNLVDSYFVSKKISRIDADKLKKEISALAAPTNITIKSYNGQ